MSARSGHATHPYVSSVPNPLYRELAEKITSIVARAMVDPAYAAAAGVYPMKELQLFADGDSSGPPTHADWVRGAIPVLLPRHARYWLHVGLDGHGHLVITSLESE